MVILIAGTTHTGKTAFAQELMEQYKMPYYSIDHLKMGLIRSGRTKLTVNDDERLVAYLWNIVKEIIKTAIENEQSIIIEGCYIPFDWQKDFSDKYLTEIKYFCLVMSENYIENHFSDIIEYENIIERRLNCGCVSKSALIKENNLNLRLCKKYGLNYILIDKNYDLPLNL
ncbi:MAG: adenylate kinase [Clostridia bacterium]|nr:adenylate kinase [Clostridia bacterium]